MVTTEFHNLSFRECDAQSTGAGVPHCGAHLKPVSMLLMSEYKRNQVEEAVARLLEPTSRKPSSEITSRLKRLLETDRGFGRSARSSDPRKAHFAFYSAEAPGTGVEIWFSAYEAFALLMGLQLMRHGWAQGFTVSVMRQVRPVLQREHARVLKLDPTQIFDEATIRRRAKEGDFAFDTTAPLLLTMVSEPRLGSGEHSHAVACEVFDDPAKAMQFAHARSNGRGGWTMFELTKMSHAFAKELQATEPRRRGRQ
jgi:hypothetical protein